MKKQQRLYTLVIAITAWFGLCLQFYVMPKENGAGKAFENFLSYFTVLTNLLVALYASLLLAGYLQNNIARRSMIAAAIVLYITVVGIVYHTLLNHLWKPEGLLFVANHILHTAVPLLFVVYWFIYERKGLLKWSHAFAFLIFPLCYIVYSAVHGAVTGFYPYPFIDVSQLGYPRALLHTAGLLVAFLLLGLLVVWVDRKKRISAVNTVLYLI